MTGDTLHLLGLLIARRWRRILFVTVLVTAFALGYNLVHGPAYTARMRVLVAPDGIGVADHGQAARNLAALLNDPGFVRRMVPPPASLAPGQAAAEPRPIARRTAERLGLVDSAGAQEAFYARLARGFSAASLGDTDVARLELTWDDAGFAAAGLEAIVAGTQRAVSDAGAARAALAAAQAGLAEAQGALDEPDANGGVPYDPAQAARERAAILTRLDTARAQADQIRLAIELARRAAEGVEASYHGGGWVVAPDAAAGATEAASHFAGLLEKRQALTGGAARNASAVAAIDGEIAQLREQNYRAVRALYAGQIATAQARLAPLTDAIAGDEAAVRTLDARAAESRLADRDRHARLAALGRETARLRQAQQRIDGAWQEVGAVRVLGAARPPGEADWPSPALVLRASVLGGIAAGLLGAAWAEARRRTIDYPADITRRLGLEVLARLAEEPVRRAG